ncbi:MAG: hypothetical protein MI861_12315, partial [Pirellulales bacterium]|nr:hypothetical protein [Pirellulales bacterium]
AVEIPADPVNTTWPFSTLSPTTQGEDLSVGDIDRDGDSDLLLGTQGWRRFIRGSQSQPNVDFREQLIRLLELDGPDLAQASPRFDNRSFFEREFKQYRAAAAVAWSRLLLQARLLMVAVVLIWLGATLVRVCTYRRSSLASLLLIASASLLLYGCSTAGLEMNQDSAAARSGSESETMEAVADTEQPADDAAVDGSPPPPSSSAPPQPNLAQHETVKKIEHARSEDPSAADAGAAQQLRSPEADDDSQGFAFTNDSKYAQISEVLGQNLPRSISKEDLKRLLSARGLDSQALADQLLDELRFPVRQYAHQHNKQQSVRQDFAETLYWQPMLVTDSKGQATIRFDLSDSVTLFRIHVDGHASSGRIGSGQGEVVSRLPFQIEPKLPLEVTTGDRIDLPIAVVNATDSDLGVELTVVSDPAIKVVGQAQTSLSLSGDQRDRQYATLKVVEGSAETDSALQIRGVAGGSLSDTVRRSIHVSPAGYPARTSLAGVLDERAKVKLPIPHDIVDGSLAVTVRAYPSPLADVMSGIESILREPHGCFEQTSATNYPNTMALLYMQENDIANAQVSGRARGMLDRGYQKLTSFECQQRGYEWFGKDPGHEALSAFGLMQFTDMARVMLVSDEMVTRTRKWLMGRRDGQGGFHRNPRHLHVWSVQQPIVNAYVLWAISEADVAAGHGHRAAGELAAELDQMNRVAQQSDDPYLIALSAAALMNVKRTAEGEALLQKLTTHQAGDGGLQGKTTVTSSGGISLKMETTALATLAWLKSPRFLPQAQAAAKWITVNRQGNAGFGSTQATVLALKALVAMSNHRQSQSSGGVLQVRLHDEVIGQATLPNDLPSGSTVEIKGLGVHLQDAPAEVEIELVAQGTRGLSYTVDVAYHAITPQSDAACPVQLSTQLQGEFAGDRTATLGSTFTVKTTLKNVTDSGQPMTVAIVGLPGGLEPRPEELDELQDAGKFDYYELRGREVIFYWRTLPPQAVKQVDFTVTAEIPGKYAGPASRAYLYYTAEQKHWIEPLRIEIAR